MCVLYAIRAAPRSCSIDSEPGHAGLAAWWRKPCKSDSMKRTPPERTPDGRYIVVNGRRWRASDPSLPPERRQALVNELMQARRDIARAKRLGDTALELDARQRVHAAKVALGERGRPWWERDAPTPAPDQHS
jgi:uncharacterized protein